MSWALPALTSPQFRTVLRLKSVIKSPKAPETNASDESWSHYQELLGGLNYLAVRTRFDISSAFGVVSRYMADPTSAQLKAVQRTITAFTQSAQTACSGQHFLIRHGYAGNLIMHLDI